MSADAPLPPVPPQATSEPPTRLAMRALSKVLSKADSISLVLECPQGVDGKFNLTTARQKH